MGGCAADARCVSHIGTCDTQVAPEIVGESQKLARVCSLLCEFVPEICQVKIMPDFVPVKAPVKSMHG